MWPRYRCVRESPLKSIHTTSVSTIAAFIEKALVLSFLGATPEAWPRSRRPTHLRSMDGQADGQTPSPGRRPAMRRVPQRRESRSSAQSFCASPDPRFQDNIPPFADSAAGEKVGHTDGRLSLLIGVGVCVHDANGLQPLAFGGLAGHQKSTREPSLPTEFEGSKILVPVPVRRTRIL